MSGTIGHRESNLFHAIRGERGHRGQGVSPSPSGRSVLWCILIKLPLPQDIDCCGPAPRQVSVVHPHGGAWPSGRPCPPSHRTRTRSEQHGPLDARGGVSLACLQPRDDHPPAPAQAHRPPSPIREAAGQGFRIPCTPVATGSAYEHMDGRRSAPAAAALSARDLHSISTSRGGRTGRLTVRRRTSPWWRPQVVSRGGVLTTVPTAARVP